MAAALKATASQRLSASYFAGDAFGLQGKHVTTVAIRKRRGNSGACKSAAPGTLRVDAKGSLSDIKRSFKQLAGRGHPIANTSDTLDEITEKFLEDLTDPEKKVEHAIIVKRSFKQLAPNTLEKCTQKFLEEYEDLSNPEKKVEHDPLLIQADANWNATGGQADANRNASGGQADANSSSERNASARWKRQWEALLLRFLLQDKRRRCNSSSWAAKMRHPTKTQADAYSSEEWNASAGRFHWELQLRELVREGEEMSGISSSWGARMRRKEQQRVKATSCAQIFDDIV